ncbi:MAG TPA: zinc-ribbon domain-containing protein [Bryobacteraceae bacterium]|nr:zinc-ribbon domain-containing protein [Bryobacteraceae bacterium]
MPFCSQCGTQVGDRDAYCGKCGSRQPAAPAIPRDPLATMTPRTAAILCYIPLVGWIASIVVLASARFRNDRIIRFHAFQGLYLFVAWLIADQVLGPVFAFVRYFPLGGLVRAVVLGVWLFMLVKASQEEVYSLPVIGELAERSVAER